jgi:hypothetical protein
LPFFADIDAFHISSCSFHYFQSFSLASHCHYANASLRRHFRHISGLHSHFRLFIFASRHFRQLMPTVRLSAPADISPAFASFST